MTKITAEHLARGACVYIRQSTADQLVHNHESQRRQYGLADRARQLGWTCVEIIDDDLGRSAGGINRPGFERLLAAICEGRVGAVFAIEASRLARNGRDWHTLIEFCGLVGTILIDEDGVYDPRLPNDRLLLGMKGTMSELELSLFRQRSHEALMWTAPHVNCQLQHPQRYAVTSGYALRQGMAFAVPHQAPARRVHGACPSPPPQFSSSDGIWHRQIEPSSAWRTTARHGLTCDKRRPCQSPRVQPDTVQATSCVTQSRRAMLPAQRTSKRPHGHRQIRSRLSAFACHSISGCSYCLIGIPLRTDDDLSGQGPQADPSGLLRGNGRAWARRSVPHQAPARRVYGVPPLPPPQFPSYDGIWHRQIEPSSAWRMTLRHDISCDKRWPCQSPQLQPDAVQGVSNGYMYIQSFR